jgi:hypothetical protein
MMVFHPECENISSLFTSKTMECLSFWTHGKRGILFPVKGAQSHIVPSGLPELHKLTDEFHNICGSLDLLFGG